MKRNVAAELEVEISAPTTLEFQIAVTAHPGTQICESLTFVLNGHPVEPMEVNGTHGNRIHKLKAPVGALRVDYSASIVGRTEPAPAFAAILRMLAPRHTLVRIATGRDAADNAFLDNHRGAITLTRLEVSAILDGDLPRDSIDQLVSIG